METANTGSSRTSVTKYERLRRIGIGSYGVVFKCVNRQTGQIVAIKRYSENDSDPVIRKIAMREVRMLRQLKHPNLIQLLEVFRRKRILHLVFDYCELTVLDVIERYTNNCPLNLIRKIIWQLVNGVSYCHSQNCIHRDIKPENILINQTGIVKLCDFGFARNLIAPVGKSATVSSSLQPGQQREVGEALPQQRAAAATNQLSGGGNQENLLAERQALTEYVATRWYRAPELLVGDIYYDIKIDIWAIGCVAAELMRGEPLWPGKTDLEQLCLIKSSLGQLTSGQRYNLLTRGLYEQAKIQRCLSQTDLLDPLDRKLPSRVGQLGTDFVLACLAMDPAQRPSSDELLRHEYIHSILMGQFVRGVVSSHSGGGGGGRPLLQCELNSAAASRQKPVGHGPQLTGDPLGQAQIVHRSNSQAILRVAASHQQHHHNQHQQQQPPNKRLLVGPEASSDDQAPSAAPDLHTTRVSFRSASKPPERAIMQPKTRDQTSYKSRKVPRSQSQAAAINELAVNSRALSRERSSRLARAVPGGTSQYALQPRRTSGNFSHRNDQTRAQIQRGAQNAVDGRAMKTHNKLAGSEHDQPARNTTGNSTSNSTRSSITPSSMTSSSRHEKSFASSLLPPVEIEPNTSD